MQRNPTSMFWGFWGGTVVKVISNRNGSPEYSKQYPSVPPVGQNYPGKLVVPATLHLVSEGNRQYYQTPIQRQEKYQHPETNLLMSKHTLR